MKKKDIVGLLNEALIPIHFKRKGNNWLDNHGEIVKIVNLQKSNFGNYFYVNYGFLLKNVPLNGLKDHIGFRLASIDPAIRKRLNDLLDLDSNISNDERYAELKEFISRDVLGHFSW
jgi:hypothetical protein